MQADLDRELLRAMALARSPEVAAMRKGLDLPETSIQWGFARVTFFGLERRRYEPVDDGPVLAFIIPCIEGGELVDLAAVDPWNQHLGTRLDIGKGFGLDYLERARQRCCRLNLCARPIEWLRTQDRALREVVGFAREVAELFGGDIKRPGPIMVPREFVYLFDLAELEIVLADVPQIICPSIELAERVQALLPPSQRDRVVLP